VEVEVEELGIQSFLLVLVVLVVVEQEEKMEPMARLELLIQVVAEEEEDITMKVYLPMMKIFTRE
jgi:hypothetical protein